MNLTSASNPILLSVTHRPLLFEWSHGNSGEPAQQSQYSDQDMDWIIWSSYSGRCKRFFSPLQFSAQLWVPPTLIFNGQWGFFPGGKAAKARLRMCAA